MDIIEMTRNLGREIQNTTEYLNLVEAKQKNDSDNVLADLIGRFNLVKLEIQRLSTEMNEDSKEEIEKKNEELRTLYEQVMQNENMIAFNEASQEINNMMNKVNTILTAAVNGDDPMTCPDSQEAGCSGSCGGCSGCN